MSEGIRVGTAYGPCLPVSNHNPLKVKDNRMEKVKADQISHAQARTIAHKLLPEGASQLFVFAEFGEIRDAERLLNEISIRCQSMDLGAVRRGPLALYKYARRTGVRTAVPNWGALWDEITPVTVEMC